MVQRFTWSMIVTFGMVVVFHAILLCSARTASGFDITPKRGAELSKRFPNGVVPIWALTQDAPVATTSDKASLATNPDTIGCPPSFELTLPVGTIALRFDSTRSVTELYEADYPADQLLRYDIYSNLAFTETEIPIAEGNPYVAADLDLDGNVEIVVQFWDELRIHSSPDWALRASFVWPGYNVFMNPTLAELDGDPYPEIFLTPNTLGLTGRIVVIDYDPVTDTFVTVVDYIAAEGAYGQPAIGDFDEDGRTEVICGSEPGYHLYEWQESTLVDIGFIGDSIPGGSSSATACRPFPNGKLYALLGHSVSGGGFLYQLLEPTADNTLQSIHYFQDFSSASGIHPCRGADTDCDGLDELVMGFYPGPHAVWEWDVMDSAFVESCLFDHNTYGTFINWYSVDLDQNGAKEFASVSHLEDFYAFPSPNCIYCDSLGQCPVTLCTCDCFGDPDGCQGEINVFDVVSSVDEAFRSGPPIVDPSWLCPFTDNDVTCNNAVDVFDVVAIVDVAFRSADPAVTFCNPCAP